MFKSMLLLGVFLFSFSFTQAQTQKDSLTRKYLICKSSEFIFYSKIFIEGKRLLAVSNDGKKCRGKLKIINDTVFSLTNSWNLKCDTFNLQELMKLKTPNIILTGLGIICLPFGFLSNTIGIVLVKYGYTEFGGSLIGLGLAANLAGFLTINGTKLNLNFYHLKIYQAKGFKLKKKHLKYLYPNN